MRTGASPWVMWSSEWHSPEATNLTRTSCSFGSSSCRSTSSQPRWAARAMAARVVMVLMRSLSVPGATEGHGLHLGVLEHRVGAHRPAEAAALVAAERAADDPGAQGRVDRDLAGLQAPGELDRLAHVAGPDRGDQAVVGAVGDLEGLVVVVHRGDPEDRAEDLLLVDPHVRADVVEQGRLHEVAALELVAGRAAATEDEVGALFLADLHVLEDPLVLLGVDERAHVDLLVPGA